MLTITFGHQYSVEHRLCSGLQAGTCAASLNLERHGPSRLLGPLKLQVHLLDRSLHRRVNLSFEPVCGRPDVFLDVMKASKREESFVG